MAAKAEISRNNATHAYLVDLDEAVLDQNKFYAAVIKQVNRIRQEQADQEDKAKTRRAPM